MNLVVSNIKINRQNLTDGAKLRVYVPASTNEVRHEMLEAYGIDITDMTDKDIYDCYIRTDVFYNNDVQYDIKVTTDSLMYRNNQYDYMPDMTDHKYSSYVQLEVIVRYEDTTFVINDHNMSNDDEDMTAVIFMTLLDGLDLTYDYEMPAQHDHSNLLATVNYALEQAETSEIQVLDFIDGGSGLTLEQQIEWLKQYQKLLVTK